MANRSNSVLGSGSMESSVSNDATLQTGLANPDFFLPFFHYMTIPKNTAITSYESYVLTLPISQTYRVWVEFPSGCVGLVGVQLWRGIEQIFPLPANTWLRSNGYTFAFYLTHLIDKEPYEIEIRGYNLDDTYQHTIWVALELRGLPTEPSPQVQAFLDTLR